MSKRYSEMTAEQVEKQREYVRRWQRENPDKKRTVEKKWRNDNRERQRDNVNRWRKAHPERQHEKDRRYRKNHPEVRREIHRRRRARKSGLSEHFTEYEWKVLCEQYDNRCLSCGQQKPLTADHVIPLTWGGTDTIDNIQPLCMICNSIKGNRHSKDYRNKPVFKVEQLSLEGF